MDPWWAWAILLLVVGMALAVLEVFIPSGGILGFLAICSVLASIAVPFLEGHPLGGVVFLAAAVFGMPVVVALAFRWWPNTPMGRKVLLDACDGQDVTPDSDRRRELKNLIGRVGRAKSKMLPSGAVSIDGRTVDGLSEGVPIELGQPVRVIKVQGTVLVVRPVDEEAPQKASGEPDPLARPMDDVGPDPFEEPTA